MNKPKTVKISAKCSDLCFTELLDAKGKTLFSNDGYVPDFFPDEHFGDYVVLEIDLATGKILNWRKNAIDSAIVYIRKENRQA